MPIWRCNVSISCFWVSPPNLLVHSRLHARRLVTLGHRGSDFRRFGIRTTHSQETKHSKRRSRSMLSSGAVFFAFTTLHMKSVISWGMLFFESGRCLGWCTHTSIWIHWPVRSSSPNSMRGSSLRETSAPIWLHGQRPTTHGRAP